MARARREHATGRMCIYLSTRGGGASHDGECHISIVPKSHDCSRLAPPLLGGKWSTSELGGEVGRGRRGELYMYMCICIYIYIYVHICVCMITIELLLLWLSWVLVVTVGGDGPGRWWRRRRPRSPALYDQIMWLYSIYCYIMNILMKLQMFNVKYYIICYFIQYLE